jgi:hypothetical protein
MLLELNRLSDSSCAGIAVTSSSVSSTDTVGSVRYRGLVRGLVSSIEV